MWKVKLAIVHHLLAHLKNAKEEKMKTKKQKKKNKEI